MLKSTILTILAFISSGQAHMQLAYPPPFNATNNPHRTTEPDTELNFPHDCCGKKTPFPCRGYLDLLGSPDGAPTAVWAAGSTQQWALAGPAPYGGNHYGGSCQIGFSIDQGKTFRVVTSYEGACPHRHGGTDQSGQEFDFTVPSDLPSGDHIFAWTWFNREQEFFMSCAAITITGGQEAAVSSGQGSSFPVARSTIAVQSSSSTSSIMTLSTRTTGKVSSQSVRSSFLVATAAAATTASIPAGMHEIHGCSCRCGHHTTHPNGSIDVGGCNCTCPHTIQKRNVFADGSSVDISSAVHNQLEPRTADKVGRTNSIAFNSRPEMFYANIGNGCFTPRTTTELQYPNPGPDVIRGDGEYPLGLPYGSCQ